MAVDETLKSPGYAKRSLMELVSKAATVAAPPSEAAVVPIVADDDAYAPPPKKSDPLPQPGDRYQAHARFLNRLSSEQKLIHFIHGDFVCDGFSYHDLRRVRLVPSTKPGEGPLLVLRFIEAVITEVTITGTHLFDLHYYISEGTMPWVWEKPKGFKISGELVTTITSITFREIER